jgi:hypothetical protein
LVRHCFCPLVEEGDGGVCCGFRSERVWRDDLLPRFEFAVTRTVIHFSIWGACGISKRLSGWGEQIQMGALKRTSTRSAGAGTHTMK